jgi:cytoskeletal protein CcmA (bactofilin family)
MTTPSPDTAVVDRHATLTGRVSGHDLIVLGTLDGDLQLSGRLHTAAGSRLRAKVHASVVEIEGDFEGEVRAATLRVSATARARGTFVAERLVIQEGAVLEGAVQAPAAPEPASSVAARSEPSPPAATVEPSEPPTLDDSASAAALPT